MKKLFLLVTVLCAVVGCSATAVGCNSGDILHYDLNADGTGYAVYCYGNKTSKEIVIPGTHGKDNLPVKEITENAFYERTKLESIVIPDNVTTIGYNAFKGCTALTNVSLSRSLTSINANAFSGCTALKSITIPSGVSVIERNTFYNCKSLESIIIPESVTEIKPFSFHSCMNLTSCYYGGNFIQWAAVKENGFYDFTIVYYYSETQPLDIGTFWHYADDGVTPVKW